MSATSVPVAELAGGGLPSPIGWEGFGHWANAGAAFCCALVAVWIMQRRARTAAGTTDRSSNRFGGDGRAEILALWVSAGWAISVAGLGADAVVSGIGETLRNLAWLGVTYTLFARDGRHASMAPIRPMLVVLALLELLQPALLLLAWRFSDVAAAESSILQIIVTFRLLVVIGALVMVHNLYVGAMGAARSMIRWTCAALALLWGYDLNYYTIAYLGSGHEGWGFPLELTSLRGVALVAFANLLAIGVVRQGSNQRLSPSRAVAFQSLSLLVIGIYLVVMVGASRSLAWLGAGPAHFVQLAFALGSTALCIAFLPSSRLRGWLKVTVAKHFFQHRYDYRAEWLRFSETIGRAGPTEPALPERVIKVLADITDAPCGVLILPDDTGHMTVAARWQWRTLDIPAQVLPREAMAFFERDGFIVDLDAVRAGVDHDGERAIIPQWLLDEERAWAIVPLLHFGRLAGVVMLGRPSFARTLDWEDFDLLRVVGRQLASHLAEHASQHALLEAAQFEDFNRRIAFVMHDIKNLASQLGLLAHNAERHADNPAFRADMLITLRNASERLGGLLARLSRYGAAGGVGGGAEVLGAVTLKPLLERVAAGYPGARITIDAPASSVATANSETLEQVLRHLVQNALEASEPNSAIEIRASAIGFEAVIEVIDYGCGMSAEFMRTGLFKPFVSTKPGGFGIGAFESRELVQAMRGRLEAESRQGLGSRFVVRLPLTRKDDIASNFGALDPQTDGDRPMSAPIHRKVA
jgi:putative PEP-CTERM system histidine kinase